MTIAELDRFIIEELSKANITEATGESRIILRELLGIDRGELLSHPEREVSDTEYSQVQDLLKRRCLREPLQYILGRWSFMGLDFDVRPGVLIPRPDTEILVESALQELHDGMRVLDLCTGTGCILISLMKYSNRCTGVGVDISEQALTLARDNASRLLDPDSEDSSSAEFILSDLYEEVSGRFDMLVTNPPYIDTAVVDTLEPEVREYEPHLALDGGADGLELIRRIIASAKDYLIPGSPLIMEIGADQGERVSELMKNNGLHNVNIIKDYAGLDRVVMGYIPINT